MADEDRKSKLVFIAGPYFGDGRYETIENNIREAKSYAIALANRGVFFFCPHNHTAHFGDIAHATEDFYKALDFVMLKLCSGAVFTPRWQESGGARAEHEYAKQKGLKIFYPKNPNDLDEVEKWAKG